MINSCQEYRNKYCKCDKTHFDIQPNNDGTFGVFHKGVWFATITDDEYHELYGLTEKERINVLNNEWNYYFAMQD